MTAEGTLRNALRDALSTYRVTLFFVTALLAVYVFEGFVAVNYGAEAYARTFVASDRPTPALVFAPFAHSIVDAVHLVSSVCFLVAYGGRVERWLPDSTYFALVVGAGYASIAAQVATYLVGGSGGTLGASGAVMALVAFLSVTVSFQWVDGEEVAPLDASLAVVGVGFAVFRIARDLGIFVPPATGSAPVGHLTGAFVGVGYAVWRARRTAG